MMSGDRLDPDATTFDLPGGKMLEVVVTSEGVIMDCYDKDELVGTVGMMADEWFDWVVGTQ